jgi:hypothetical protein
LHSVCQRGIDDKADHHYIVILKIGAYGLWEGHMKLYGFYRNFFDQGNQNHEPLQYK